MASLWEALAASKVSGQAGGEQALAGAASALSGASQTAQNLFDSRKDMYEGLQKTISDATTGIQDWLGEDPTFNPQTQMWEKGSGLGQLIDPHYERNARRTAAMNAAGQAALARRDEALFGLTGGAKDTSSYATQQAAVINSKYGNILDSYGLTIDQAAALANNPYDAMVYAELHKDDLRFKNTQAFIKQLQDPKLQEHLAQYTAVKRQLEDREAGVKGEYYYEAMADATADTDALSGISRADRIRALKSQDEKLMGKKDGETLAEFNTRRSQNELGAAFGTSGAAATVQALKKSEDNIKQLTDSNTKLEGRIKQLEDYIQQMTQNISQGKAQMYSQFNNTQTGQQTEQPQIQQDASGQPIGQDASSEQLDEYANVGDRKIDMSESLNNPQNIESLQNNRDELYLLYAAATGFESDDPNEIEKYVKDQMSLNESGKLEDDDRVFNITTQDGRQLNGVSKKQLLREIVQSEKVLDDAILKENFKRVGWKKGRADPDYYSIIGDNNNVGGDKTSAYDQLVSNEVLGKEETKNAADDIMQQEKGNSSAVQDARENILKKYGDSNGTGETNFGHVIKNEDGSYTVVPTQAKPAYIYSQDSFKLSSVISHESLAAKTGVVGNVALNVSNVLIGGPTNKDVFTLIGDKSALTDEKGNVNGFWDGLGNLITNVSTGQTTRNDSFDPNNQYSPLERVRREYDEDLSFLHRAVRTPVTAAGAAGIVANGGKNGGSSLFAKYISPFLTKTLGPKGVTIANSYNKAITQVVNFPGFSILAPAAGDGAVIAGLKSIGRHTAGTTMFLLRGAYHSPRELAKGVGKLKESLLGKIPTTGTPEQIAAANAVRDFRKKLVYGTLGTIGAGTALKFAVDHFEKTGEVTEELADHIATGLANLNPDQRRQLFTKLYLNEKQDEGNIKRGLQTIGHSLIDTTGLYNDDAAAMYSQIVEKNGALDIMLKLTDRGTRALAPTIMAEAYKAINGDAEAIKKFKGLGISKDNLQNFYDFAINADLDFLVKQIDNSALNADTTRNVLKVTVPFLADAQAQADQVEINQKALELQNKLNDGADVRLAATNSATVGLNNLAMDSSAATTKGTGENIKNTNSLIQQSANIASSNKEAEIRQQVRNKGMTDETYNNIAGLFKGATSQVNIKSAPKSKNSDGTDKVDTADLKTTGAPTGLKPINKDQIAFAVALSPLIGEDYHDAANTRFENMEEKYINKFTSLKNKYFDTHTKQFKKGASIENFMREFSGILNNAFFSETNLKKALKTPDNLFFSDGAAVSYITRHIKQLFPIISQLMFLHDGQEGLEMFERIMTDPNFGKILNNNNNQESTKSLVNKQNRKRPD